LQPDNNIRVVYAYVATKQLKSYPYYLATVWITTYLQLRAQALIMIRAYV